VARWPVIVIAVALVVGSCSRGQIERTVGDVRIWQHASSLLAGGEDAIVSGAMVYDRTARCMYLEIAGIRYPVIWPVGARIESTDPVSIFVSGESVVEGDYVAGGGGFSPPERFEDLIPPECHGDTYEVAVFNAGSRIELRVTRD
jgi:hypothetical protein